MHSELATTNPVIQYIDENRDEQGETQGFQIAVRCPELLEWLNIAGLHNY